MIGALLLLALAAAEIAPTPVPPRRRPLRTAPSPAHLRRPSDWRRDCGADSGTADEFARFVETVRHHGKRRTRRRLSARSRRGSDLYGQVQQLGEHWSAHEHWSRHEAASGTTAKGAIYGGLSLSDNESVHIEERKHEAMAAVRLVTKDGDVIWSTTQESNGAKFRGASADVADKVTKQLLADVERVAKGEGSTVRCVPALRRKCDR